MAGCGGDNVTGDSGDNGTQGGTLFGAKTDYGVGSVPGSVFSADLDGDGDNDLAVANQNSDNVSVLMNLSKQP